MDWNKTKQKRKQNTDNKNRKKEEEKTTQNSVNKTHPGASVAKTGKNRSAIIMSYDYKTGVTVRIRCQIVPLDPRPHPIIFLSFFAL